MQTMNPRIEDLPLKLIPMELPPRKPVTYPIRLAHLKSGAKKLVLSPQARDVLGSTDYVQVLADGQHIAIRAAKKNDQHARPVGKAGNVSAIELVRVFGPEVGERLSLPATLDAGHLVARIERGGSGS